MAARLSPQLPVSRRSEPAYREQRRQKVEEYLSRKKTFSGVPVQKTQDLISSRTRRATSNKLQDKTQLSTSLKPEMENKENDSKLSWDQSSETSGKKAILNSSTVTLSSMSDISYNPEAHVSKDEVTEKKSKQVSFSKSFLQIKNMKEKQLTAEKQNSSVSLPKKPMLGTYRGKVIPSKINSFRKAPKREEEKSSLPEKKLPSATKPSKPSDKAAINSQSSLKKQQPSSAVAPKKVTDQKRMAGRGPQPLKAASNHADHRGLKVKKCVNLCDDAGPEAPANPISVAPGTKSVQNSKTNDHRKSILLKELAENRRARLDEWKASRGKVMKRPPISMLLGSQSKSEEQKFSSADSLEHSEKINKTLTECLELTEQGCQGDQVCAMLEDLAHSIPGAKKLAKYWICCIRLEQMSPLEKLIAVYEEAILAGARPKDELRHALIDTMRNTEGLLKSEGGGTVIEAQKEAVEVVKEPHAPVEEVQETFKYLGFDDNQKAESDDKKAEISSEVIIKEVNVDLKPREEFLPKKNKKQKTKDRTKKKGKCEPEEQNEDEVKLQAQAINSPEKENDSSYLKYNPSSTPCLERVKMHNEANDSSAKDLKMVTPLRYSQRIREKMCKLPDSVKDQDPCISSFEQLGELESKATAFIHKQSNELKETSAEVED